MEDRRTNDRTNDARSADTPPMTQRDAQMGRREAQTSRPSEPLSLIDRGSMAEFERRWNSVQGDFVEDPRRAVGEAGGLLADLFEHVGKGLRQRRSELGGDRSGDVDTEALRQELRRYRGLMQSLLGDDGATVPARQAPRTAD